MLGAHILLYDANVTVVTYRLNTMSCVMSFTVLYKYLHVFR